jgi:glycopeptide antibiotics resistance protein
MRQSTKSALWISQGLFLLCLPVTYRLISYLHPIAFVMVWFILTTVVFLLIYRWRREKLVISYRLFIFVASLYSLTLLILLFFRPADQNYLQYNLIPFTTIWGYLTSTNFLIASYNLLANIALFIPFGLFLMFHYNQWHLNRTKLFFIPAIAIVAIELFQYVTQRGSLDIDDFLLNFIGVQIGYRFFPFLHCFVEIRKE